MNCPKCYLPMTLNSYWRARQQGFDYFCTACCVHYRLRDGATKEDW